MPLTSPYAYLDEQGKAPKAAAPYTATGNGGNTGLEYLNNFDATTGAPIWTVTGTFGSTGIFGGANNGFGGQAKPGSQGPLGPNGNPTYNPTGDNPFGSDIIYGRGGDVSLPEPPSQPSFNGSSDPNVLAALALEQQGLSQLDSSLKSARERAIISFGDPALAEQAGFGLDPQAGAFARQNYLSGNATLARLDKQHELARRAVINRLVGRGLLRSGDLGYGEQEADAGYGNQVYDAKQQLLDYLSNLFNTYNEKRQGLSQNVLSARLSALQNFLSNPDGYAGLYG